jgi:hypothetical protein
LSRAEASSFSRRYSGEIRRLNLDLKQEREQRILDICHAVELDFLDSEADLGTVASQVRSAVEAMAPNSSWMAAESMLELNGWPISAPPITVNINQQVVNAVESTVFQNIRGLVNFGPEATELLGVVDAYGGEDTLPLQNAVYELEDQNARPANRRKAKNRLKDFLQQLGRITQDVATEALEKYVEKKLGM